jgi:hypothetical protein
MTILSNFYASFKVIIWPILLLFSTLKGISLDDKNALFSVSSATFTIPNHQESIQGKSSFEGISFSDILSETSHELNSRALSNSTYFIRLLFFINQL